MYKVKRFGLSTKLEKNKFGIADKDIPNGAEREDTQGYGKRNLRWKNVDKYKVIDDDPKSGYSKHRGLLGNLSSKSEFARNINKRVTQLVKDLNGKNSKKTQYVTIDNPNTDYPDETHMIKKAVVEGNKTWDKTKNPSVLPYTKDVNGEFRLSYLIEKPHKEGDENVSNVVLDDINDHEFKGKDYISNSEEKVSSYFPGRFK